jgi:hypothetical protein
MLKVDDVTYIKKRSCSGYCYWSIWYLS